VRGGQLFEHAFGKPRIDKEIGLGFLVEVAEHLLRLVEPLHVGSTAACGGVKHAAW